MQNGHVESFIGRMRDECLNANWFATLADARQEIETWRQEYGIDGKLASGSLTKPRLPVRVNIGGIPAEVLYAGGAPGLVAGVLQVNARIPLNVPSGEHLVELVIGNIRSSGRITVSVN